MTSPGDFQDLLTSALTDLYSPASLPRRLRVGCGDKIGEPRFGGTGKFHGPAAPDQAHGAGMQRLMGQHEPRLLPGRQAVFDQRQVQVLVTAIQFVANNRMAEVREVDADLMFAAGVGSYAQKRAS